MKKKILSAISLMIISLVATVFSSCEKKGEIEITIKVPTLELVFIKNINESGATIVARIASSGGSKITEKGIVLDGSKNIVSTSSNSETTFTIVVSNLEAGRSYSVKAYAKNSQKTGYSNELKFTSESIVKFSIDNTGLMNVASDKDGNIYVSGFHQETVDGLFIAKFSPQAKLLWSKDILGKSRKYLNDIVVNKDIIYAQVVRNSNPSTTDWGTLSIDAYDATNGNILWSTEIKKNTSGADFIIVSEDNFIYSISGSLLSKLDLSGNIVAEKLLLGSKGFSSIVAVDSKILAVGSALISGKDVSMLWFLDKDLNTIWSQESHGDNNRDAYASGITFFPDNNLIFVSESNGNVFSEEAIKSYILCYEHSSNEATLKWKKFIGNNRSVLLKKDGNNLYAYSTISDFSDNPFVGPALFDTSGNIIWQSDKSQTGNLAIFKNNLYIAQETDSLVVIKK